MTRFRIRPTPSGGANLRYMLSPELKKLNSPSPVNTVGSPDLPDQIPKDASHDQNPPVERPFRIRTFPALKPFVDTTPVFPPFDGTEMDAEKLLKAYGWSGSGSLDSHNGAESRGLSKPLLVSKKVDVLGVGLNKHAAVSDQWWMRAYDSGLKDLGTGKKSTLSEVREKGMFAGGLYGRFVKGESEGGTIEQWNEEQKKKRKRETEDDSGYDSSGKKVKTEDGELVKKKIGLRVDAFTEQARRKTLLEVRIVKQRKLEQKAKQLPAVSKLYGPGAVERVFKLSGLEPSNKLPQKADKYEIERRLREFRRTAKEFVISQLTPEDRAELEAIDTGRKKTKEEEKRARHIAKREKIEEKLRKREAKRERKELDNEMKAWEKNMTVDEYEGDVKEQKGNKKLRSRQLKAANRAGISLGEYRNLQGEGQGSVEIVEEEAEEDAEADAKEEAEEHEETNDADQADEEAPKRHPPQKVGYLETRAREKGMTLEEYADHVKEEKKIQKQQRKDIRKEIKAAQRNGREEERTAEVVEQDAEEETDGEAPKAPPRKIAEVVDQYGKLRYTVYQGVPIPLDPNIWRDIRTRRLPKEVQTARKEYMLNQRAEKKERRRRRESAAVNAAAMAEEQAKDRKIVRVESKAEARTRWRAWKEAQAESRAKSAIERKVDSPVESPDVKPKVDSKVVSTVDSTVESTVKPKHELRDQAKDEAKVKSDVDPTPVTKKPKAIVGVEALLMEILHVSRAQKNGKGAGRKVMMEGIEDRVSLVTVNTKEPEPFSQGEVKSARKLARKAWALQKQRNRASEAAKRWERVFKGMGPKEMAAIRKLSRPSKLSKDGTVR
ncbi:hypothetical protein BST61_g7718 [Cercospora zeina]